MSSTSGIDARDALLMVAATSDAALSGLLALCAVFLEKNVMSRADVEMVMDAITKHDRLEKVPDLARNIELLLPGYQPKNLRS